MFQILQIKLQAIYLCLLLSNSFISREVCALTHSQALSRLNGAGISVSSSGNCSDRNNPSCTSLEGIRDNTVNSLVILKGASNCPIIVTGGTETGHGNGAGKSHWNGYKVDIGLNPCINSYITRSFRNIGKRGDGAQMYRSAAGNVYANEGNHWDIVYI